MRKCVERVREEAPRMTATYQKQLRERVREAGLALPAADDERLLKEVVYFADRSDITEELTRLLSHFKQYRDCQKSAEPVGRTLDFLAQEMNREINTIGSKANNALISREVVTLKAELEKFREQVQNVE
jgi:uncharacterized protein (TIGR00255 family)